MHDGDCNADSAYAEHVQPILQYTYCTGTVLFGTPEQYLLHLFFKKNKAHYNDITVHEQIGVTRFGLLIVNTVDTGTISNTSVIVLRQVR